MRPLRLEALKTRPLVHAHKHTNTMFKAIGTVIILWWLAAHLPATFTQLDHTGVAVLGAIETIATSTTSHGINMPQVVVR